MPIDIWIIFLKLKVSRVKKKKLQVFFRAQKEKSKLKKKDIFLKGNHNS